ncbi:MAG: hypothetical protein WC708_08255, partial [Lentisphaeria bacterium]
AEAAPGFHPTPEPQRRAIAAALRAAGFTVTLRRSLGTDIAAACGQLAGTGDRPVAPTVIFPLLPRPHNLPDPP